MTLAKKQTTCNKKNKQTKTTYIFNLLILFLLFNLFFLGYNVSIVFLFTPRSVKKMKFV